MKEDGTASCALEVGRCSKLHLEAEPSRTVQQAAPWKKPAKPV